MVAITEQIEKQTEDVWLMKLKSSTNSIVEILAQGREAKNWNSIF